MPTRESSVAGKHLLVLYFWHCVLPAWPSICVCNNWVYSCLFLCGKEVVLGFRGSSFKKMENFSIVLWDSQTTEGTGLASQLSLDEGKVECN